MHIESKSMTSKENSSFGINTCPETFETYLNLFKQCILLLIVNKTNEKSLVDSNKGSDGIKHIIKLLQ